MSAKEYVPLNVLGNEMSVEIIREKLVKWYNKKGPVIPVSGVSQLWLNEKVPVIPVSGVSQLWLSKMDL
jgi:hypothetical protein